MSISVKSALGPIQGKVQKELERLSKEEIIPRIWYRDPTVWKEDITEIANRLGWLDCPWNMRYRIDEIQDQIKAARDEGFTHALLLGMGGSSLAPEVFRDTFGVSANCLDLRVLDSTDPGAVLSRTRYLNPARTLFIPATKSGGTVETISFLKYCYTLTTQAIGADRAGRCFAAITDPGPGLADLARDLRFRHTFLNDPNIGGRYSALSCFGLVAAGAIGVNLKKLLERAREMANLCKQQPADNPAALLGAAMGAGALDGRDKLTLIASPALASFGAWIEQLIAESTGKEGRGILPIDGEPCFAPSEYGSDRIFVHLRMAGDEEPDPQADTLVEAGHPVIRIQLDDEYDLGGAFFLWEMATVIAGNCLDINPFDQPNVESAKKKAREMVDSYEKQGELPLLEPILLARQLALYGAVPTGSLRQALDAFLERRRANHSYIALQAYLSPSAENDVALRDLRSALLRKTGLATTVGYGPRFLHSTGQLHKGDGGDGLFLQLTADPREDVLIPDQAGSTESTMSFGVLIAAQALGDRQALLDAGRQVLRVHLGADILAGIEALRNAVK